MGIIFYLSSLSTLPSPDIIWWDFLLKKSAHMFEYGVLFFLLQRALSYDQKLNQRMFVWPFLIGLTYAMSDELHQSLTPGRFPKITDVGFDSLGMYLTYLKAKQYI